MFRKNKLSFFENGVVSFNFPISEHVLGARASRTTHPRVLADCSRLFSQLLSDNISIQNPYLYVTGQPGKAVGKGVCDAELKTFITSSPR
jgi:hypothetical protein